MLYGLWLRLRHLAYNKGWKKSFKADVPTVCVGNITVGGTGKTPHVEMLLRQLRVSDRWGFKPLAVLSRGYKRKSRGFQIVQPDSSASFAGDEPLQIARKFHGVLHRRELLVNGMPYVTLPEAFVFGDQAACRS